MAEAVSSDSRVRITGLLAAIPAATGMLTAFCSILGFFGASHWTLDLFSHFRVQYAVILFGCLCCLIALRSWRASAFCGVFAALNLALLLPFYFARPAAALPGSSIRVLLINVNLDNRQAALVKALIRETRPDDIVIEEANHWWSGQLKDVHAEFPFAVQSIQESPFGIAVFSRDALIDSRIVKLGKASGPAIFVRRRLGTGVVNILAMHAFPPLRAGGTRLRNSQLEAAADFIRN